jgi:hypothetical protein
MLLTLHAVVNRNRAITKVQGASNAAFFKKLAAKLTETTVAGVEEVAAHHSPLACIQMMLRHGMKRVHSAVANDKNSGVFFVRLERPFGVDNAHTVETVRTRPPVKGAVAHSVAVNRSNKSHDRLRIVGE